MPLWEGFDEPFHYAYVQNLSVHGQLPIQGQSNVSQEIRRSMELTPASHVVQRNIPWLTTFDRYFALPLSERRAMQGQLWQIPTDMRKVPDESMGNYEAQQAPLAYLLLAGPDRLLSGVALPLRTLILRIFCGMAALLATLLVMRRLLSDCHVPKTYQVWALAMLLCSQMFYASVCRVSNEWLAVPVGAWLFSAAIRFYQQTSYRRAVELGLALGAGLLTKGYFLSLVPFVFCVVVVAAS